MEQEQHGCEKGRMLMEVRDKALDAMDGVGIGKQVGAPDTPEAIAEQLKSDDLSLQAGDPAYAYNEHVKACPVCTEDNPQGRYSVASR